MSYLRSAGLAVMLLAGLWAMAGTSPTEALAADPEMSVWVNNVWWTDSATDSFSAVPMQWDRSYMLWSTGYSATVPGTAAEITLPAGFDEAHITHWSERTANLKWNGATSTAKFTATGSVNVGGQMTASMDIVPMSAVETPLVSVTRSISDPILTGDVQTRTLGLDLTVKSSLAAYNPVSANLIWRWDVPENISYEVLSSSTWPAGFHPGPDPGTFYADDASTLVVGNTYHFTADVQITRSGPLAQAVMGDLYHKPQSTVTYSAGTIIPDVTGTSVTFNVAPGVDATFSSGVTTTFHPGVELLRGMSFDLIAAGVGPATPSRIGIGKDKRASEYARVLANVKKGDMNICDEAGDVFTGKHANTKIVKKIEDTYTVIRGDNLFTIWNLPTFFILTPYFRNWRIRSIWYVEKRGLCHVYHKPKRLRLSELNESKDFKDYFAEKPLFSFIYPKYEGIFLEPYLTMKNNKMRTVRGDFQRVVDDWEAE